MNLTASCSYIRGDGNFIGIDAVGGFTSFEETGEELESEGSSWVNLAKVGFRRKLKVTNSCFWPQQSKVGSKSNRRGGGGEPTSKAAKLLLDWFTTFAHSSNHEKALQLQSRLFPTRPTYTSAFVSMLYLAQRCSLRSHWLGSEFTWTNWRAQLEQISTSALASSPLLLPQLLPAPPVVFVVVWIFFRGSNTLRLLQQQKNSRPALSGPLGWQQGARERERTTMRRQEPHLSNSRSTDGFGVG